MNPELAHTVLLPAVPPFSLAASLGAMSGFRPSAGDQAVLVDRVRKGLAHPDHPRAAVVVEVSEPPDARPGVRLDVYADRPLSPAGAGHLERRVAAWLSLGAALRPLLALMADDPPVAELLPLVAGLHQVRFSSLAEGATYFTLTQRSTQWFATARKARMASELGRRIAFEGETYVAFPGLDELAALGADGLFTFAGNAQRALRLAEVLSGVAALDEQTLRTAPYDEARSMLLGVRGIGTFTADAILLRVLGRPDDAPLEMNQFTTMTAEVYGPAGAPAPALLRERYEPYVGWWAYLCRTALGVRRRQAMAEKAAKKAAERAAEATGRAA
ncbi:DNA-3-methyladenine glycosylase [Virgisporangium ochraceum]